MKGLTNIKWFLDKLENIPKLNLGEEKHLNNSIFNIIFSGKFELIECSGVLHHLPDPQAGLNIISQSLTDRGGMALMVYAR